MDKSDAVCITNHSELLFVLLNYFTKKYHDIRMGSLFLLTKTIKNQYFFFLNQNLTQKL